MRLRVVFMGTPEAAVPALEAVSAAHDVVAVYTRPDKPRGRGRSVQASPVKEAADRLGIGEVVQPRTLRDPDEHDRLRGFVPDVVVVVAFGYILPPEVLDIPRLGCVNVHFSLLPRWRGAAPVERAIMAGDAETGVVTMLMDEGLDTGPMLLGEVQPIHTDDTAGSLTQRLADQGASLLIRTLDGLADGTIASEQQPSDGATYADKIVAEDAELDWSESARSICDRIRGLHPHPGAFTWNRGRRLKVWRAHALEGEGRPGVIVALSDGGPQVGTGDGLVQLTEVQPEGKKAMTGVEFARGYRPEVGDELGRAED